MTNEEILERVIEKAEKNGFDYNDWCMNSTFWLNPELHDTCLDWIIDTPEKLIFDHKFAKAFFGEEEICMYCGEKYEVNYDICQNENCMLGGYYSNSIEKWQYHLQQMVIKKEPLKYLEKFL